MVVVLILCLVIIGFLGYQLYQKKTVDTQLVDEYKEQIKDVKEELNHNKEALEQYRGKLLDTQIKVNTERQKLTDLYNQLDSAQTSLTDARDEYQHLVNDRMKEIDQLMDEQRQRRQESLDETFNEKKAVLQSELDRTLKECDEQAEYAKKWMADQIEEAQAQAKVKEYQFAEEQQRERFLSLRKPLLQYEMDKQAKLFYTIQLPEEYRDDIEFLLTTVAAKVQHPDIISKLVWAEYVKPNLDDTFKRIEIKPEPGIYKLTNLDSGKAYIGKSTDIKKRIADHFKSAIGLSTISDQAVHHEIRKTGFWNWTIEVIIYCDKDKLSELEKYYIDFFKTQEFGFNKRAGG